ncbi:sugar ABC transporter ATP-binding protein [Natranaerofaba carboxydovora]|uniref:sugar ABC transporter ATP-binding protein n=1 Tax=Natranaerofaba carboxydovora TaxID=2742683 RepID=UPI001F1322A0|nr:sugar ABC transporter ATP-binding protein [Natranaerofaba carboxydovora]UMZ74339.1 Ribose import ATP-binding protein RbsA [Natranaerofaba carboxydovora]
MGSNNSEKILRINKLSKFYPGTIALNNVNFEAKKGEVHGIIGKNGAGKSTLVNIMSGIIEPTDGEIVIKDKNYSSLSREVAREANISIVPQEPNIIEDITVAENLFLPEYASKGRILNWQNLFEKAEEIIDTAGLNINVRVTGGDLSPSEQQLLLIVKAFYVEEPEIIILDEATSSLTREDISFLFEIINKNKNLGKCILFISHITSEILDICDRVTVLRDGMIAGVENCCDLDEEKFSHLIIGEKKNNIDQIKKEKEFTEKEVSPTREEKEVIMKIKDFNKLDCFQDIDLELRRNEIVGIAGLRGSGRTEIMKAASGIDPSDSGEIEILGNKTLFKTPYEAFRNGVVYLPEDREEEGIIKVLSVRKNLVLNAFHKIAGKLFVSKKKEDKQVQDLIDLLEIKVASPEEEIENLSGGNKQKVVVGKILSNEPLVYLLDEPTKGVDVGAKESILRIIKDELSADAGIILTAPGVEDLMVVCDRILILHEGRLIDEFTKDEFDEENIYIAIQGKKRENKGGG